MLAFVAVLGLIAGGGMWLRESSLVAVEKVTVTGATGPDAALVRAALENAALDMTTLHVRAGELRTAVEPFPAVKGVDAQADFPHGLRVRVREHVAVAAIVAGGRRVATAGDGTLLRGSPSADLPVIAAQAPPSRTANTDARVGRAVALLAAAPPALRRKVRRAYVGPRGLTAPLRNGPVLYFGGSERLTAKWTAAARVLADRSAAGATYLDLRLPERPAAGGLEPPPALEEAQAAPTAPEGP